MSAYTFEPELSKPTPRRVRLREPFAICTFRMVTLVPAILASAFVAAASKTTWEFFSHWTMGRTVEGHVMDKSIVQGEKRESHFVEFKYSVDGQDHAGRARVNSGVYSATKVGDPIRLQTLPWSPESSRVAVSPGFELLAVLISWGITTVPCVIFGGFFWQLFYKPWRQRKLVRHGRVSAAVVTSIESGDGKGGTWRRLHYEYAPANGTLIKLKGSIDASGPDAEAMNVGDPFTVIYDQRLPHRSVPYRFAEYRVVTIAP